jgi:hypothetical protein
MMTDRIDKQEKARMITQRGGISTNVDPGESATVTTECEAGEVSLSGGFTSSNVRMALAGSGRFGTTGWLITVYNASEQTGTFKPSVICMQSSS